MSLRYPSPANLAAALLLMAVGTLCLALARWQWHRAGESRAGVALFAAGAELPSLTSAPSELDGLRYRRLRLSGHYVPEQQFLLDNMVEDGRAGYEVLTPFRLEDGGPWLLVNRGWLPANPDRRVLPEVDVSTEQRAVVGRLDRLPRSGLKLGGDGDSKQTDAVAVLSYPTADELAERLGHAVRAYQILLDGGEPDGFGRAWRASGMGPERHLAYAGQWVLFACVAVVAGIAIVWRGLRRQTS